MGENKSSSTVPQLVSCTSVGPGHPQAELCNVCHGYFMPADFGVLGCSHIFCLRCLLTLLQRSEELCPTCRQTIEGLDRINFVPLILSLNTHFSCSGCAKTEISRSDVRWCVDCVELLCHDCEDKHSGHPIGSFDPVSIIQLIYQQFQAQSRHLKTLYEEQKAHLDILANWVRDEFVWELIGELSRKIHDQYAIKGLADPKPLPCNVEDEEYHECPLCRDAAKNVESVRKTFETKYREYLDAVENRQKRWLQLFGGCLIKKPTDAENKTEQIPAEGNAEATSAVLDAALEALLPTAPAGASVAPTDPATTHAVAATTNAGAAMTHAAVDAGATTTRAAVSTCFPMTHAAGAATVIPQASFETEATTAAPALNGLTSAGGDEEKTLEPEKLSSLIRMVVPVFGRRLLTDLAKNDHSVDEYATYLSTEALRARAKKVTRNIAHDTLSRWSIPTLDSVLSGEYDPMADISQGAGDGADENDGEANSDTSSTVEPPADEPAGNVGSGASDLGGGPPPEVGGDAGATERIQEGTGDPNAEVAGSDAPSIFGDSEMTLAVSRFEGRDAAVVQATGDIVIACEREGLWVFNHRAEFKLAPRCKNVEYDRTMRRVAANDDLILVGSIDGTLTVFHAQTLDHLGGCFALPDWVNESKCRMTMSRDNLYLLYGDRALYRISLELFNSTFTEEQRLLEEGSVHLVCSLPVERPAHDMASVDDTLIIVTSTYPTNPGDDADDSDDSDDEIDDSLRGKHQLLIYDGLSGERILQKEVTDSVCRRHTSPHLAVDPTERLLFVSDDVHTMCFEVPELKYRGRILASCYCPNQALVATRGNIYDIDLKNFCVFAASYHQSNAVAVDATGTGVEYEPEQKPA